MIRVNVKVDSHVADQALKDARRDIYRKARSGMKAAAEKTVLPAARRETDVKSPLAPSQLIVKTTSRSAFLTAKTTKQGRILGLLNFGGHLPPVKPRKKKALKFAGVIVSQTNKARTYRGKHFLEEARDRHIEDFGEALLPAILMAFEPLDHTP